MSLSTNVLFNLEVEVPYIDFVVRLESNIGLHFPRIAGMLLRKWIP